ncbi:S1-C subfamily serine protease [Massilia sp. UYP11]|uniref:PDZ domain-containing protein n=1 Tax=Massilia sp. UYP11 TaxID=1756385 RepID=UPI003D247178
MKIDTAAAGKTAAVIAGIWAMILVGDLSRPSSPQPVSTSEGIAHMVRGVFGLNGDAPTTNSGGSIADAGLTAADAGGVVLVASVKPGSIAEQSGFKVGDQIGAVNRNVVHNAGEVATRYEGQGSTFNVKRNGISVYPNIEMGKVRPMENLIASAPAAPGVGLDVMDMVGMYPAGIHAPMTMNPVPDGLAAGAGIKAEQWVTAVNGKPIKTAAEYRQLAVGDGPLTLTVVDVSTNPRTTKEVKIR